MAPDSTAPVEKTNPSNPEGIGAPVLRKEDARLLVGAGRFVGDIVVPGMLHAAFVRAPHAHAAVKRISAKAARKMPGVAAVFTGAEMEADAVGPMRSLWPLRMADGTMMNEPPRWALARGKVRHVGEPVAVVLAETRDAAMDAAEAVDIDYAPLPAVVGAKAALAAGAPQLHAAAPGNRCFHWVRGAPAAVEVAFAKAAHIVRLDIVNHRIAGAAIEPRAVLGVPEPGGFVLYSSTQVPHHIRRLVTEQLGLSESAIRVVAPDVGGGFGYKGKHYPEEIVVAWAARKLGRAVRWVATRNESFLADNQARDHLTHAELALDRDGVFLGLKVETFANLGAYVSTVGAAIPSAIYSALLAGVYRTPAIHVAVTGVFTNTLPTDAYRGAGRPEACFVLERLADRAARELGIDRAEIRRRNLIPRSAMPYATPIGPTYDSGDFPEIFGQALIAADYVSFAQRKRESEARGLLRGVGLACYVESSGVAPSRLAGMMGARAGFFEAADIRVEPDGSLRAALGTHNHGQGHATTFAQILSDRLGVPLAKIAIVEGDTAAVPYGTGTFGSRSMAVGGSALDRAAMKIVAKGRQIAAHLLEAAESDIEFAAGTFRVTGTDRALSFAEIARVAYIPHNYPLDRLEPGLAEGAVYDPPNFAFSNGAHVCEVELDPETGRLAIARYTAVDDIGTVINPVIAHGQVQGGLAQGIGQAVLERCVYDGDEAQLLSASFLDYAMPRADDLPFFASAFDQSQPCAHNPLGAKGCGESGTIGAPAAVVSAVLDALAPLGIDDIEMPLTPARLWQAIRRATAR
ncbi:MAG: xanthine dehydrogenase family protein [Rhodospirillaceae bacterium]|nr:xanthine dehydrogenase family protein [Rhodospirillaceae bacterium]